MIRPRTLAITPILTITGVSAVLVGAAMLISMFPEADPVYEYEYPVLEEPAESQLTAATFPRHFTGSFRWDGETMEDQQILGMDVEDVNERDNLIVATGRGTYTTNRRGIDFTFRIEANPQTGEFTMWESNPSVSTGFVTEGRHEATFTDNLDVIRTRWIGDNGMNGTLDLQSAERSSRTSGALGRLGGLSVLGSSGALGRINSIHSLAKREVLEGEVIMERRYVGDRTNCVLTNDDRVTVHYSGWNDHGVFDDSWERGHPATFRPSQVIKGWTIALKNMCAGDFARVWIPADHAYGNGTNGSRPYGDLVFDIEVLSIQR